MNNISDGKKNKTFFTGILIIFSIFTLNRYINIVIFINSQIESSVTTIKEEDIALVNEDLKI